jgi:hypothetical protein
VTRIGNTGAPMVCACRRKAASPVETAGKKRLARRTRGAASWALPSIALALVPKCPMCIAAYLAIGGSLGVSLSTAAHLRTALVWLCWSVLVLLTARTVMRFRTREVAAARQALRSAQPNTRRSQVQSAAV